MSDTIHFVFIIMTTVLNTILSLNYVDQFFLVEKQNKRGTTPSLQEEHCPNRWILNSSYDSQAKLPFLIPSLWPQFCYCVCALGACMCVCFFVF